MNNNNTAVLQLVSCQVTYVLQLCLGEWMKKLVLWLIWSCF